MWLSTFEKPSLLMPPGPAVRISDLLTPSALDHRRTPAGVLADEQPFESGTGVRFTLEDPEGEGHRDVVRLADDMFVLAVETRSHADWFKKFVGGGNIIFQFRLSGPSTELYEDLWQHEQDGPVCRVLVHPPALTQGVWIRNSTHYQGVSLFFKPAYFTQVLGLDPEVLPPPLRRYVEGGTPEFAFGTLPLTAAMRRATVELLQSPYRGRLRLLHAEAKAKEMTCLTLHALESVDERATLPARLRLWRDDVDRLREARDVLASRCADPPQLARLARMVGLNRNKLAYGFRHLFGMTPWEFCQQQRAELANTLLREGRLTVTQVAEQVGYADPSSFSKVFRRHYGILPSDVRADAPPAGGAD